MRSKDFRFFKKAIYVLVIFSLLILPWPKSKIQSADDECQWTDEHKKDASEMNPDMWDLKDYTTFGYSHFEMSGSSLIHYFTISGDCKVKRKVTYTNKQTINFWNFYKWEYFETYLDANMPFTDQVYFGQPGFDTLANLHNNKYFFYDMPKNNHTPLALIIEETGKDTGKTIGLFAYNNNGKYGIEVKAENRYKIKYNHTNVGLTGTEYIDDIINKQTNYNWKNISVYAGDEKEGQEALQVEWPKNDLYYLDNISFKDNKGGDKLRYGDPGANLWKYIDYFNNNKWSTQFRGEFTIGEMHGCTLEEGDDKWYTADQFKDCFFRNGVDIGDTKIVMKKDGDTPYFILPRDKNLLRTQEFKFVLKYAISRRDIQSFSRDYYYFVSTEPNYPSLAVQFMECTIAGDFVALNRDFVDRVKKKDTTLTQKDMTDITKMGSLNFDETSINTIMWDKLYPESRKKDQTCREDALDQDALDDMGVTSWIPGKSKCQADCMNTNSTTIGEYMCEATCIISEALGGVVEWIINSLLLPAAGIS
jgi:hypothetical protein